MATAQYCYLLEGGRTTKHGRSADFENKDLLGIGYVGA
jgi:branched-chain amino acid transport system ATP-binding protein